MMNSMIKKIALLSIAGLLAGCAGDKIKRLEKEPAHGFAFADALKEEYAKLAHKENDKYSDWIDASHFAVKGLQAAAGLVVEPEHLRDRQLPKAELAKLHEQRRRLRHALQKSGRRVAPKIAAEAQVAWDCYLEELEEGPDLHDKQKVEIEKCKNLFVQKLKELEKAVENQAPTFVVWFDLNSSAINYKARAEVSQVAKTLKHLTRHKAIIFGKTDGVGGRAFNLKLSQARADAIKKALLDAGVPESRIESAVGLGEAKDTKEYQPDNRRVEIHVH